MEVLVEVATDTGGTEAEETMLLLVSSMMEDEDEEEDVAEEAIWVEVTTAKVSLVGEATTVEVASTRNQYRIASA